MSSILTYPNRGPWGDARWRGNCSGHIYKELFSILNPKSFCDPMKGSGTSIEVANEMGIEAYGLDLHEGFNILRHSVRETIGTEVELCFSHPPYGSMIVYSGNVWGTKSHIDDLSRCGDDEDFLEKLQVALFNQREATKSGGYYGILIGDRRKKGAYTSYQAEIIARMPSTELTSVLIKAQHNCVSDKNRYGNKLKLPRIMHEYIILWQKPETLQALITVLTDLAKSQHNKLRGTWRSMVKSSLIQLGGKASFSELYDCFAIHAPEIVQQSKHWKAKIRQTVQIYPDFNRVEAGIWELSGGKLH